MGALTHRQGKSTRIPHAPLSAQRRAIRRRHCPRQQTQVLLAMRLGEARGQARRYDAKAHQGDLADHLAALLSAMFDALLNAAAFGLSYLQLP